MGVFFSPPFNSGLGRCLFGLVVQLAHVRFSWPRLFALVLVQRPWLLCTVNILGQKNVYYEGDTRCLRQHRENVFQQLVASKMARPGCPFSKVLSISVHKSGKSISRPKAALENFLKCVAMKLTWFRMGFEKDSTVVGRRQRQRERSFLSLY